MYELITKLLLHGQLKFEEGSISLLGQDGVMVPVSNICDMQKIIEECKKGYEIYVSAKKLGQEWIRNVLMSYKMDTIDEQVKWGENVFTLAGFGKMRVKNWNVNEKTMIYNVLDSTMAKFYGNVGRCVDHIPRGWFAGASTVFFKSDVDCVETMCLAKGDEYCEFLIKPRDKFDFTNPLVKAQLMP